MKSSILSAFLMLVILTIGCSGSGGQTVAGTVFELTDLRSVIREESTSTDNSWQARVAGTQLIFHEDGTFEYVPPGIGTAVRSDLYPVSGSYQESGNVVNFDGYRQSSAAGNAAAEVKLVGTLQLTSDGTSVVRMTETNVATTAAVVNETPSGSSLFSEHEFEAGAQAIQ